MSLTSFLELVKALQIQETLQKLKLFEKRKLLKILWKGLKKKRKHTSTIWNV